jgi:FixJ family two-component response regulator
MTEDNPWGLTPRQAEAMDAVIETGCHKLAARKLGVEVKTLEGHTQHAREKIGTPGRLTHMLLWDRWRQQTTAAQGA